MLIRVDPIDEAILKPVKDGLGVSANLSLLFLEVLVDPEFLKGLFEPEAIVSPKRDNFHTILFVVLFVPDRNIGVAQTLVKGVNQHISADAHFVVAYQSLVSQFVDHGNDHSPLCPIYFQDENISVAILVDDAEIVIAVGVASEHRVALG